MSYERIWRLSLPIFHSIQREHFASGFSRSRSQKQLPMEIEKLEGRGRQMHYAARLIKGKSF